MHDHQSKGEHVATQTKAKRDDPFRRFRSHAMDMRAALNQIAPGLGYGLGNMELLNEVKEEIRYANGETLPPASERMFLVAAMMELASTTTGHSKTLAKNMASAGDPKPVGEVESHHIVAWRAEEARLSRLLMFGWCIAINDHDNGVHLPAYLRSNVVSLAKAIKHRPLHTSVYHGQVYLRLLSAARVSATDGRVGRDALKLIKTKILNGTFPYKKEHLA
jgi:hypothetical protein